MPQNFTDITDLIKAANKQHYVSYGGPEKAPPMRPPEASQDHVEVHEVVEHEPEPDVAEHVTVHPEVVKIPQDLQEQGVESTGQTHFPTHNAVQLPISDDKVIQGLKSPMSSSVRWLAEFCLFLLHKAHIKLKLAHGKAVRMFDAR